MNKTSVKVIATSAAGQIAYSLLFRIASGSAFDPETPVESNLLEITPALYATGGIAIELFDFVFPLLAGINITNDPAEALDGASAAFLAGTKPRGKGGERSALLGVNGKIFNPQGAALDDHATDDIEVLVVGNPADTSTMITAPHAKDIPAEHFTAMIRLDHNHSLFQLSEKIGVPTTEIRNMIVWGNHSVDQFPNVIYVTAAGEKASDKVDVVQVKQDFIPCVVKCGAKIIEIRSFPSAASATAATVDCIRNQIMDISESDWVSVALPSDGSCGIDEGLVASVPYYTKDGEWVRTEGLDPSEVQRVGIKRNVRVLCEERDAAKNLLA